MQRQPGPGRRANGADGPTVIPGQAARQGGVALRRPWQRWVLGAGLAGLMLLVLALALAP